MNLNSPLFDRIRVRGAPEPPPVEAGCDHPGCRLAGLYRAPMGRLREGQYFCFCLDHVREYNASYNYFNGMSDDDVARYQRDAVVGHRPTWKMGANGQAHHEQPSAAGDPLGMFRDRSHKARAAEPPRPRRGVAAARALDTLGLDEMADAEVVRARYKDLVKRLHPDANGGDRSSEDRLREIITAYKQLKALKLA